MPEPPAQPRSARARLRFDLPTSTICWLKALPKAMDTLSHDICALFQIQTTWDMCVSFVKLGFPMDQEPIFDTCLPCLLSAPAPVMLAKHDKLGG